MDELGPHGVLHAGFGAAFCLAIALVMCGFATFVWCVVNGTDTTSRVLVSLLVIDGVCVMCMVSTPLVTACTVSRYLRDYRRWRRDTPAFALACALHPRLGAHSTLHAVLLRDPLHFPQAPAIVLDLLDGGHRMPEDWHTSHITLARETEPTAAQDERCTMTLTRAADNNVDLGSIAI